MITDVDVLIIGGGWTGVSTALRLHEHNAHDPKAAVSFALLEGHQSRLGGRAYSYDYEWTDNDGIRHKTAFEHGAQYIGETQSALWRLIQKAIDDNLIPRDALVDGYAARLPYKEQVMVIAGKRFSYNRDQDLFGIGGVPPGLGLWDLLGVLVMVELIQAVEQRIDVVSPWKSPKWVTDLDQLTLGEWIDQYHLSPAARSLLRITVEAVISVEASQVSAFYFFWYCACNGGFLNEINDEDKGPQQYYLASGLDDLVEKLAAPIAERIVRGQVVQSVDYAGEGVTVTTTDNRTFRAKKVIVATSPASAKKVLFYPPLPAAWQTVMSQPMGTTVKCQVFYRSPWWRNVEAQANRNKQGVPQYTGYAGATDYPVLWVMDYSPVGHPVHGNYPDVGCYALMTFTIGAQAHELLRNPSKEHIVTWVTTALCNLFNDTRALSSSSEYLDLKWFTWDEKTPLIPGGPNTVFAPGILTGDNAPAKAFDLPVDGKVYFAAAELSRKALAPGSASQPTFVPDLQTLGQTGTYSDMRQSLGYMDGAVTCGRFVAGQVLADLSRGARVEGTVAADGAPAAPAMNFAAAAPAPVVSAATGLAPADAPPLSEATVAAVLTTLCELIYDGSVPPPTGTTDWTTDPRALQTWLSEVLTMTLVKNNLVEAPPTKPTKGPNGYDPSEAAEYMEEMAEWAPKGLSAILAFMASGYAWEFGSPNGSSSEVTRLSSIATALLELRSREPTNPSAGTTAVSGFFGTREGQAARGTG